MVDPVHNVLIAAVGGQGAVLASRILGSFAVVRGFDVKVSEIHGMSQRGGSVVTHVRFGAQVFSPVIERGAADALLGFELLEAMRYADYLRPGAMIIVNQQQIPPQPVLTGDVKYPLHLEAALRTLSARTFVVDARKLAAQAGSEKAVNTVLLGAFAALRNDDKNHWRAAFEVAVPRKHLAINLAAFDLGYAAAALNHPVADVTP